MRTETLSWEGETTIELNSIEYLCNFDCEVQVSRWTEKHNEYYSEPMGEALVMLGAFEAECGGKPVQDPKLRRELRAKLAEWVDEHETRIMEEAK